MIFALQWVRENAASFGGDPDNLIVFGESAGAMAIVDFVVSPLAKGLLPAEIRGNHFLMGDGASLLLSHGLEKELHCEFERGAVRRSDE